MIFQRKDRVVRKDVSLGVREGTVIEAAGNRVEVAWDSGKVTTVNSNRVLLATPENVTTINNKRLL